VDCAVRLTYEYGRPLALPVEFDRAATGPQPPYAEPGVLVVFVRTGCPHCADAKVFLADYAKDHPELRIVYRPVDEDPRAAADLVAVYEELGVWPPGVPTFVMNGHVLVGFRDAEYTGPALRELIEAGLPARNQVETALFGTLSASRLGLA
jgi:glutaredoxin